MGPSDVSIGGALGDIPPIPLKSGIFSGMPGTGPPGGGFLEASLYASQQLVSYSLFFINVIILNSFKGVIFHSQANILYQRH